ncbi:MAG: adenylate/guanylate cyclase domain-containing protein, partial [Betaproteobacteria bacterium]
MPQALRFGLLEIRPAERQLLRAGQPVALDSRAFDLLWRLVEHRDRVVPRSELLNLPGAAGDEDALVLQISALRRALGSLAIATVEDRGYRFTLAAGDADVEPAAASPPVFIYLFTDIEGSTRLWEQQAVAMRPVLAEHDAQCRQVVARHDGIVIKTTGDGVHAAFTEAGAALAAAIELQGALSSLTVADGQPLRVRMGLHAGSDEHRDGDFFGPAVNRAVRVMDAAHGGQILLSHAVVVQIGDALPPQTQVRELGLVRLRDLASSERIFQVEHPELRREFPALRSLEVTPNNLPQQLNSFVGRKHEMPEVAAQLSQQRLDTLLAMGGIGKSRLAV